MFLDQLSSHGLPFAYFSHNGVVVVMLANVIYDTIFVPYFKLGGISHFKIYNTTNKITIIRKGSDKKIIYIFTNDFKTVDLPASIDLIYIVKNFNVFSLSTNNKKKINKILRDLY